MTGRLPGAGVHCGRPIFLFIINALFEVKALARRSHLYYASRTCGLNRRDNLVLYRHSLWLHSSCFEAARCDVRPAPNGAGERIGPRCEHSTAGELYADNLAPEKLGLRILPAAALIGVECVEEQRRVKPENLAMDATLAGWIENGARKAAHMIEAPSRGRLVQKLRTLFQELRIGAPAGAHQRAVDEQIGRSVRRHGLMMTLPLIFRFSIMRIASAVSSSGNT